MTRAAAPPASLLDRMRAVVSQAWPPVRIDLEIRHHAALNLLAVELGTTRSAIVRALLDQVADDPALAGRLVAALGRPVRDAARYSIDEE